MTPVPKGKTPNIPETSFTVIVPTAYGRMLVNRNDINQANHLFKTGLSMDHGEIAALLELMRFMGSDLVVVDVGANFGTFALALAWHVGPNGKVYAFEPQRLIYNMLVGSVALNSMTHVYCFNMAVGDHDGKIEAPQFNHSSVMNFGSVEFSAQQKETLHQKPGYDPDEPEYVPLTTLDSFEFKRIDILKIDVEGMEPAVMDGAARTLARCRPVILVEVCKCDGDAMIKRMKALNYNVYKLGLNLICIPDEKGEQFAGAMKARASRHFT